MSDQKPDETGKLKCLKPVCAVCGSENVVADAWAEWDVEKQDWELRSTFDDKFCEDCEGECSVDWVDAAAPAPATEEND
jgi:hypothetical protein